MSVNLFRDRRKNIFKNIYAKNKWGGNAGEFYSGSGSYNEELVDGYTDYITQFIEENQIQSIVDLGCGDFHVASFFADKINSYIGIDIVEDLVQYNQQKYGKNNIKFQCLDIVEDSLPKADLCLIRQVLQHCTNKEIVRILEKCADYKNVLITENVWRKDMALRYNCDIQADRKTRRGKKSGVYLEEAPFNCKVKVVKKWPYGENEDLVMYLLKNE